MDNPDLGNDNINGSSLCGIKFPSPFLSLQLTVGNMATIMNKRKVLHVKEIVEVIQEIENVIKKADM
jgi:hypothetical protein